MAFMLGVRVASYCLAGAAVIVTHDATKTATQKLYHWLDANKHNLRRPWRWSRSPDPEPDHAVNEPDDALNEPDPFPYHSVDSADGALTCEPRAGPSVPKNDVTDGSLTAGPSVLAAFVNAPDDAVEEPFPYHSVDSADGALTCEPRAGPSVPKNAVTDGSLTAGPSVLAAFVNAPDDAVKEPFPYHSGDSADGALTCEPRVGPSVPKNAVTGGDPTAGPSVLAVFVVEPFLYGAVDSSDGAHVCKPRAKPKPPEIAATDGDLTVGPSVLTVVEEAGSTVKPHLVPAANAVSSGSLPGSDRPDYTKPSFAAAAADGISGFLSKAINAVRTWGMKLLDWWFPADGACNSKGAAGDTGWTLDPDLWDKIGRIAKKILLWAVEHVILERAIKRQKAWRQVFNIVKAELKFATL